MFIVPVLQLCVDSIFLRLASIYGPIDIDWSVDVKSRARSTPDFPRSGAIPLWVLLPMLNHSGAHSIPTAAILGIRKVASPKNQVKQPI